MAGNWEQHSDASVTDYDPSLTGAAGKYLGNNTSVANNDEIHFGSLSLNAGTYKIIVGYVKTTNAGIIEVLLGTTSIGTVDAYGVTSYNNVATFTYSPTARVSGNLRLKITNKNAGSSGYFMAVGRLELIRTG